MLCKIILITGYPDDEEDKNLDKFYLNYYYHYFRSNGGGAYDEDEIYVLEYPSTQELKQFTTNLKADFVIVIFIGHGGTVDSNHHFKLNESEIIKIGQLHLNVKKQLILVESCRDIIHEKVYAIDLNDKLPKFKYGGKVRVPINREKVKEIYNESIIKSEEGVTICLAAGKGESAWNYFFSFSLLQASFNWHLDSQNHLQTLGIIDVMNFVKNNVNDLVKSNIGKTQNPEVINQFNFPFAVSKF